MHNLKREKPECTRCPSIVIHVPTQYIALRNLFHFFFSGCSAIHPKHWPRQYSVLMQMYHSHLNYCTIVQNPQRKYIGRYNFTILFYVCYLFIFFFLCVPGHNIPTIYTPHKSQRIFCNVCIIYNTLCIIIIVIIVIMRIKHGASGHVSRAEGWGLVLDLKRPRLRYLYCFETAIERDNTTDCVTL